MRALQKGLSMKKKGESMASPLENLLKGDVWGEYTKDISALKSWKYWDMFSKMLRDLKREVLFTSPVHGVGHIERTMLHGAMAAMDNSLSWHETKLLLTVCAYHDTGRLSDWLDDSHGKNSAYKLHSITGDEGDNLNMMMAAMEAHSRNDKDMDLILSGYDVCDMEKCRELALYLKDCDGLDRVRLADLDERYLRHSAAVKRVGFAKYLFEIYTEEQKRLGMETAKPIDYFHRNLVKDTRDKVQKLLGGGMNAREIVVSQLGELLDVDISHIQKGQSCKKELTDNICGAYSGAAAFVDAYLTEENESVSNRKREYTELFVKQYKSNICSKMRPSGINDGDSVYTCAALILDVILFTYKYLCGED